jgi:hypothetical protein
VEVIGVARYALLASALAGRTIEIESGTPGEPSWTDAATIVVDPSLPPSEVINAVAVQACLIAAGSFSPEVLAPLSRRPALAPGYLAFEGHRALAHCRGMLPSRTRVLIDGERASMVQTPSESLEAARSARELPPLPRAFGEIRPRSIRRGEADRAEPTSELGGLRQARAVSIDDLDDAESDQEDDAAKAARGFDLSSPIGGSGAIGRLLGQLLSKSRSGRGSGAGPSAATRPSRASGSGRARGPVSGHAETDREATALRPHVGFSYPEWDVERHRYRAAWCTVREVDAPRDGDAVPWPRLTPALRRQLSGVALGFDRRRRQLQGDEIDIDVVVTERVALAAGKTPSEAVYIDRARLRRDLSVLTLLDVSGSAGDASVTGKPVHLLQRETAAALTDALDALGDRVSLYAFRSMGRSDVQVVPVKQFDQRVDSAMHRRLGGLAPGAYTRLGAAIRHGAAQLEQHGGTTRRLLLVLSDGLAYDYGYGGPYGEADARRALSEARRRGTACLCISVGAVSEPAALRRVFGTSAYASVASPEQLVPIVRTLFHTALGSAEAQRRRFTRTRRADRRLAGERGLS